MSLFDNFSTATPDPQEPVPEAAEIAELEALVAEEEQKQKAAADQIGALYVRLHHDDYEPDFAEYMSQILASEEAVRELNTRIDTARGIRRCACCGAEVDLDAAFCCTCGARIQKEQSPIPEGCSYCTNCGNLIRSGMRFCTQCGQPVEITLEDSDSPEPQPETYPEVNPVFSRPAEETAAPAAEPVEETVSPFVEPVEETVSPFAEPAEEAVSPFAESENVPLMGGPAFSKPEEIPAEPAPVEEAPAAAEAAAPSRVCPACGAPVSNDMRFCIECGQPLEAQEVTPVFQKPAVSQSTPVFEKPEEVASIFGKTEEAASDLQVPREAEFRKPASQERPEVRRDAIPDGYIACPKCGTYLPAGITRCYSCGAELNESAEAPTTAVCSKCGAVVAVDLKFCTECGAPMGSEAPAEESKPVICPSCGAAVKPGMRYCTSCGATLTSDKKKVHRRFF